MHEDVPTCHLVAFAASKSLVAPVWNALLFTSTRTLLFCLQAELQKLEKKLADALDALKVEQASNERANRRAALDQHRLEQVLEPCSVLRRRDAWHIVRLDAWL
jgi:hypothetical protein